MPTQSLLLKGHEVAGLLNISRALAYRWIAEGRIPVVRIPGARAVRVPKDALLRWIEANTENGGRAA